MDNYYLGIDVSKGYADFVILDPKKQTVEPSFQLDDTFDGHSQLYQVLKDFFKSNPDSIIFAAVESTGSYENNWFECLQNFGSNFPLKVARLNPLGVTRNSQADMKRNKTDKISAYDVAEYLIAHSEKVIYQEKKSDNTLQEHYNYVELLNKQKVQLLNHLEISLYRANPELMIYCKKGISVWVLHLLKQFPTAAELAGATCDELVNISQVTRDKALKIIERAQHSIASATDQLTSERMRDLVDGILQITEKIKKQKKRLEQQKEILTEKVSLLESFKGIGIYSAVGLLLHIDCVERFISSKHISSFYGVHPVYKKSGDGSSGFHMSKQGNSAVRRILYMITLSAIVHNPLIREIYHRNLAKGKKKKDAMGVCMHKILRIVYGMLKNNTEFDPDIDRKNQNITILKTRKTKENTLRRFQKHDKDAPISRRQTKKRRDNAI